MVWRATCPLNENLVVKSVDNQRILRREWTALAFFYECSVPWAVTGDAKEEII